MKELFKAAVIEDLSGFGRCSLTAALPILSAMGVQACPLPTAIFSNHTGYSSYYFEDFTDQMPAYAAEWEKLGLKFDAILTGFLGDYRQAAMLETFIDDMKKDHAIVLIDPAMADNGKMYATCDDCLRQEMKRLIAKGTVVTPNLTEACFLTDTDYRTLTAEAAREDYLDRVAEVADKLLACGTACAVITGVDVGDTVVNVVADSRDGARFTVVTPRVDPPYAGTGDVFAAVLCGGLMNGKSVREAVAFAADFVGRVAADTKRCCIPTTDGILFERHLKELCPGD